MVIMKCSISFCIFLARGMTAFAAPTMVSGENNTYNFGIVMEWKNITTNQIPSMEMELESEHQRSLQTTILKKYSHTCKESDQSFWSRKLKPMRKCQNKCLKNIDCSGFEYNGRTKLCQLMDTQTVTPKKHRPKDRKIVCGTKVNLATLSPSNYPTQSPSDYPTLSLTDQPSLSPIKQPTNSPSADTIYPSTSPSAKSVAPTFHKNPYRCNRYNPCSREAKGACCSYFGWCGWHEAWCSKDKGCVNNCWEGNPTKSPVISTQNPTLMPTVTSAPTKAPVTSAPTQNPTDYPTSMPTISSAPTQTSAPTFKEKKFSITLMNMGQPNAAADAAFQRAKERWEEIIINDLPDAPKKTYSNFDWFGGTFANKKVNVDIDDVLIGYEFGYIDGKGSVLGRAGPRYRRSDSNGVSPISGIMQFDSDDFAGMAQRDMEVIILHEMGHVLGIGTFWRYRCGVSCQYGSDAYTCNRAKSEYDALNLGDTLNIQRSVCGHWAESNFQHNSISELMTPYFEAYKYQPISAVTLGALLDLGHYEIDFSKADPWELGSGRRSLNIFQAAGADNKIPFTETTFSLEGRIERPESLIL